MNSRNHKLMRNYRCLLMIWNYRNSRLEYEIAVECLSIENGHKQVYISRMHMFEVLKMIITDLLFITKSNCNEKWLQIRFWCSPSNIMYWFIWIVYESYEKILLLFVIIHLLWIYNFIRFSYSQQISFMAHVLNA